MTRPISSWGQRIGDVFETRFPSRLGAWRTLGREAEHPVVHADGTAADIGVLWSRLAELGKFEVKREGDLIVGLDSPEVQYSAEVGVGTIEVIVGPANDLHGIRDAYERGIERLVKATNAEGLRVLGFGIQPVTVATPSIMTAKRRYKVLLDVLGDMWLSFAVTSSDQVHVSVSREEVVAATNLTNLLAPVSIALCANSSVVGGKPAGVCSAREAHMGVIGAEANRHGMVEGPISDLAGWIERTLDMEHLMRREGGQIVPSSGTFRAWLDANVTHDLAAYDAWDYHEHYVWNSARPRAAHGTVELRSPCQQPWPEHMAAAALGAGLVTAHAEIAQWIDAAAGADAWPLLSAWHATAIRDGLAADEPIPGLLHAILDRAHDGLKARGRGEEVYLAPLRARVERRRNPGQEAVAVLTQDGLPALIERLTVR